MTTNTQDLNAGSAGLPPAVVFGPRLPLSSDILRVPSYLGPFWCWAGGGEGWRLVDSVSPRSRFAPAATLTGLADEAFDWFVGDTRADGSAFLKLSDRAPEWVGALVHAAHGDMLPDDWRYSAIRACLGFVRDSGVDDVDELEDLAGEWQDANVDVYTADRLRWVASSLDRVAYCDDATGEFGYCDDGLVGVLGLGQYMESGEVWAAVLGCLRDELTERAGDDDYPASWCDNGAHYAPGDERTRD